MNQQARKTIGVALLLAAALLAILVVTVLSSSSPPGVAAHECAPDPTPNHQDSRGADCDTNEHRDPDHQAPRKVNTVDGGRDRKLVFHVSAGEGSSYLGENDQIEFMLPGFDLPNSIDKELIKLSGSGDPDDQDPLNPSSATPGVGNLLTLALPPGLATRIGAHEYLIVTIEKGTGILTPEIPKGFDDSDEGYSVGITLIDKANTNNPSRSDPQYENIVVVRNPVSSTVPSDTVHVELATHTEMDLKSGDEITVDFSGPSADSDFVVPASRVTKGRIKIDPDDPNVMPSSFPPSDVLVQGARVTLTIPRIDEAEINWAGDYTISFTSAAGIKNPFAAGNHVIKVWSSVEGEDKGDDITAVIRRTTTIDTEEGPRGTEFILTGKGYPPGTVTVYHDADCDGKIDAGETLASRNTTRGVFNVDLVAREPRELDIPECRPLNPLEYRVKAKDSEGVDAEVVFRIESGILFVPDPAQVGSPLKITISDWKNPNEHVAVVNIAGEPAYVTGVKAYSNCIDYTGEFRANDDRVMSLEVLVPVHVPPGEQTVALYDHGELVNYLVDEKGKYVLDDEDNKIQYTEVVDVCSDLPSNKKRGSRVDSNLVAELKEEPSPPIIKATVKIVEQNLTLTPDTAARGQKVTITATGFTRAARGEDHIRSVWIGGVRVPDDHSEFEVGTNRDIAFTVTVPLDVADGPNEVLIEGADHTLGQATLEIPKASITLAPPQGQRGTELTVTGSGFVAKEAVLLSYHSGALITSATTELASSGILADAQGGFELPFKVPVTAEVGLSHLVTAVSKADTPAAVRAEASHLVTRTDITTTPGSVSPGDHLAISARRMPPFTLVGPIKIASIPLSLPPGVATDEDGSFETKVLIPHIEYGDHTLLVQVAGVIIPHVVEVAPPPLSGPPGQVFKYPIRSGTLSTVWHYDNATQLWSLFDPLLNGEMAELNDLTEVGSGDIVWVNVSEPLFFQGNSLKSGWNLVKLE